jgi:hypothetical protein
MISGPDINDILDSLNPADAVIIAGDSTPDGGGPGNNGDNLSELC